MDYLVTFYKNDGSVEYRVMNTSDVLVMYEQILHIERGVAVCTHYPSKKFTVHKLLIETDNS